MHKVIDASWAEDKELTAFQFQYVHFHTKKSPLLALCTDKSAKEYVSMVKSDPFLRGSAF